MDARNTHRLITTLFCYMIIGRQLCHVQALRQSKPFGAELDDAKALASMHKDVRRRIVRLDREFVSSCLQSRTDGTVHDYSSFDIEDDEKVNPISLSKYQGRILLIVITASYCGYTHQYPSLNRLKSSYPSNHFQILAFPCNQFGLQEPGTTGAEILNGIRFVRPGNNYVPNFAMFERSDVNGVGERPLFTFLKTMCPSPIDEFRPWPNITYVPVRSNDVRWNFEKFLIDRAGRPVKRFASNVTPEELISHIDELMDISNV